MICPNCGKDNNKIENSRVHGSIVKRRRVCLFCGEAFHTIERFKSDDEPPKPVVKVKSPEKEVRDHGARREALPLPMIKNRTRPVWIRGQISGWAIIADYEDGDFYVYTRTGGHWLLGKDFNRKWWAYENVRKM